MRSVHGKRRFGFAIIVPDMGLRWGNSFLVELEICIIYDGVLINEEYVMAENLHDKMGDE
jgi:hypothetical protein